MNKNLGSSAKRLKRDSSRSATDGFKKCNPLPQAIPILCQSKLPPDRSAHLSSLSLASSANANNSALASSLNSSSCKNSSFTSESSNTRNQACSRPSSRSMATDNSSCLSLEEWLKMAHECAYLLNAECVSTQISKSYKEESLRFTCQNGHNFFLPTAKLLLPCQPLQQSPQLLDPHPLLPWLHPNRSPRRT